MYVLDTHVACWAALDADKLIPETRQVVEQALLSDDLYIANITLWEIAMLIQKQRLIVTLPLQEWIDQLVKMLRLHVIPMTVQIVADSVQLPLGFHADPADQLIVATTRCLKGTLITRDEKILEWSQKGFVKTLKA